MFTALNVIELYRKVRKLTEGQNFAAFIHLLRKPRTRTRTRTNFGHAFPLISAFVFEFCDGSEVNIPQLNLERVFWWWAHDFRKWATLILVHESIQIDHMDHLGNHSHHHHMEHHDISDDMEIMDDDMSIVDNLDMKMKMDMNHMDNMDHMDHSERIFFGPT